MLPSPCRAGLYKQLSELKSLLLVITTSFPIEILCSFRRAGLYKQLSELKSMLGEVRDDKSAIGPLKAPIVQSLESTGTILLWLPPSALCDPNIVFLFRCGSFWYLKFIS